DSDAPGFRDATRSYLEAHTNRDDLIIILAIDNGQIASSCMACLYEIPPLPDCPLGKIAELRNVFTKAAYRRRGLAEKLLRLLLDELAQSGVEKIVLTYTEAGLSLYRKLGFSDLEKQMQKTL
ncbi:MAG: GNAT family N-acetyltransferase, partial [Oscillospiraceae bacterium]|nr:GNAT family N-acetyltransferase [Oscillospiraceae bacterium]